MSSSHPYQEPSLQSFLILSGFLLTLNVVNGILDFIHCGLIGQIFIGVLFGSPGAKLLDDQTQTTISALGYLGLILLVYEGGNSIAPSNLFNSFLLSIVVALTGIVLPIAFSFLLLSFGATPLQCFVAGASLSSTSLGTTFTVLSNNGLVNSRMGTVLTTAAMFDDIVGLIMLQIVTDIGKMTSLNWAEIICRPIGVSIGLILVCYIICRFVFTPLKQVLHSLRNVLSQWRFTKPIRDTPSLHVCVHTALLLAFITAGNYLGTSILFSAFVVGSLIRWWSDTMLTSSENENGEQNNKPRSGLDIYQKYYSALNERILKPFFFASLGFAIPISPMVRGNVIWKGIVYSILMFIAKFLTAIWPWLTHKLHRAWSRLHRRFKNVSESVQQRLSKSVKEEMKTDQAKLETISGGSDDLIHIHMKNDSPLLLGFAMVARGEIGFLIASLAASQGLFGDNDEFYLIALWAIVICTILGPLSVGLFIRRMKQLH